MSILQPDSIGDGESVEAIFDDKFIDSLLEEVSNISEVTLIHFVENTMWVTFKEGSAALSALKLNGIEVNDSWREKFRFSTFHFEIQMVV